MILLLLFFFFVNSSFSKKKTNNEVEEQQRRNNSFYPEKRKLFTFFVFRFTFSFSIVRNISKKLKWMKKGKKKNRARFREKLKIITGRSNGFCTRHALNWRPTGSSTNRTISAQRKRIANTPKRGNVGRDTDFADATVPVHIIY